MSKTTIMKLVELIASFIVGVASVLLCNSCSAFLSVNRNNTNSNQEIHQSAVIDSTTVNPNVTIQ